ncbi:MAG: Rrf2 family transcriptional regulator [Candidatus Latescibacteria bacterium]|nr:Rrf2 family transcriptional regulator [Candidatus Latescibacterota bacterium]
MKISKAEDQSLRLVTCLARAAGQLTLADLAAREHLPEPTVAKLLARLRRGDVVVAARGRHGGYELARPAAQISVAAVLKALGRPLLDGGDCTPARPNDPGCPHLGDCGVRSVWRHLEARVSHVLEETSMDDLCRTEQQVTRQMTALWPENVVHPDTGRGGTTPLPVLAACAAERS